MIGHSRSLETTPFLVPSNLRKENIYRPIYYYLEWQQRQQWGRSETVRVDWNSVLWESERLIQKKKSFGTQNKEIKELYVLLTWYI